MPSLFQQGFALSWERPHQYQENSNDTPQTPLTICEGFFKLASLYWGFMLIQVYPDPWFKFQLSYCPKGTWHKTGMFLGWGVSLESSSWGWSHVRSKTFANQVWPLHIWELCIVIYATWLVFWSGWWMVRNCNIIYSSMHNGSEKLTIPSCFATEITRSFCILYCW